MTAHHTWIVEDNTLYREAVLFALEPEESITCEAFHSAEAALQHLEKGAAAPQVILLDLDLPGIHGLEALRLFKLRAPQTHVLILTEFDDRPKVFQAISEGASGYLLKSSPIADISRGIREVMAGGAPLNARIAKMMLSTFNVLKPPAADGDLTGREREVLTLLARGLPKKQIAADMGVSYHTVDMHTRGIYKKLQVHNLSGAVSKALQNGLI
jgi:DNA-binding NarL/FixJ family response regulator